MLNVFDGDIFKSVDYTNNKHILVHQCNCVTNSAKGLAKIVFDIYPEANIYKIRNYDISIPGEICIIFPVVNLFGQYSPGKSNKRETKKQRLEWFKMCLFNLKDNIPDGVEHINFPWEIGCGMGGGNWDDYFALLNEFASLLPKNIYVNIWRLS